ncbi:hypothetical protein NC651_037280 [Populus alba x Populus x berolinensis]|nr:hypothetical protein NC651_037280 [Populus alba x Populus x berolinensis]
MGNLQPKDAMGAYSDFKGNRLNARSCHRGLFIFQSMCSFFQ